MLDVCRLPIKNGVVLPEQCVQTQYFARVPLVALLLGAVGIGEQRAGCDRRDRVGGTTGNDDEIHALRRLIGSNPTGVTQPRLGTIHWMFRPDRRPWSDALVVPRLRRERCGQQRRESIAIQLMPMEFVDVFP